jgi:hypothetical protein
MLSLQDCQISAHQTWNSRPILIFPHLHRVTFYRKPGPASNLAIALVVCFDGGLDGMLAFIKTPVLTTSRTTSEVSPATTELHGQFFQPRGRNFVTAAVLGKVCTSMSAGHFQAS